MVDSVSVRLKIRVSKKRPLNIRMQWNAGTAGVSECVLTTLACRGLRVGPSKFEVLLSYLGSIWGGIQGVTLESLLGHFNSFCAFS